MSSPKTLAVSETTSARLFYPLSTIKSVGPTIFRSQSARDAACLLDVDPEVSAWSCQAEYLTIGDRHHVFDLVVETRGGIVRHIDVDDRPDLSPEIVEAAGRAGLDYSVVPIRDHALGFRLPNAKDLLRYGNYRVSLGDRVMLLRALEENGSMSISECLGAFRETRPMAGLAVMILGGFVEVDLDEAPLGPETLVRRIRD